MIIQGQPYKIETDFRAAIAYAIAAASGELDAAAFFDIWRPVGANGPGIPPDCINEFVQAINAFYRRSEEETEKKSGDNDEEKPIAFDYLVDADVIVSDFQSHYGIDLTTASMHWWRFSALMDGLYSYSLQDRVRFRVGSLQGMSSEQRAERARLRAKFRIRSQQEKAREEWLQSVMAAAASAGGEN